MRDDLKIRKQKCITNVRGEGANIIQKVTFDSLFYHLKLTAETLGIRNKQFMNLNSQTFHDRVSIYSKINSTIDWLAENANWWLDCICRRWNKWTGGKIHSNLILI